MGIGFITFYQNILKIKFIKSVLNNYNKEELQFCVKIINKKIYSPEYTDYSYYQYDHDLNSNQKEILEFLDYNNFLILENKEGCLGIEQIKKLSQIKKKLKNLLKLKS